MLWGTAYEVGKGRRNGNAALAESMRLWHIAHAEQKGTENAEGSVPLRCGEV